jgi:hypothetical protein
MLQSLSYGSEALLGGFNAVTPHWSGAVDIVAVRQQDGTLKSTPFYVRFGKYQTFSRNRRVIVRVNNVEMEFGLELGQYGSALFAHEVIQGAFLQDACIQDAVQLGRLASPVGPAPLVCVWFKSAYLLSNKRSVRSQYRTLQTHRQTAQRSAAAAARPLWPPPTPTPMPLTTLIPTGAPPLNTSTPVNHPSR